MNLHFCLRFHSSIWLSSVLEFCGIFRKTRKILSKPVVYIFSRKERSYQNHTSDFEILQLIWLNPRIFKNAESSTLEKRTVYGRKSKKKLMRNSKVNFVTISCLDFIESCSWDHILVQWGRENWWTWSISAWSTWFTFWWRCF